MIMDKYVVIGVMSGTSLDGIDLVYATFQFNKVWRFEIYQAETISYNENWTTILKNLVSYSREELNKIDADYTLLLSKVINGFINKYNIHEIDAVCSHGHTALHEPKRGLTYQIGNHESLASLINHTVVCDFRVQDVELGGQGAPLVPIGDRLLFSNYDYCLNLGGFANVSTEVNHERIAYDICPTNIVLNHYVQQLGFNYDDSGKIAKTGKIVTLLLEQLNALAFYNFSHPKSLGVEWVNQNIFPLIDSFKLDAKDILRTFVEHIAVQISLALNKKSNATVLVSGGGVFNTFLIDCIKSYTINNLCIPSKDMIEYKEALIFGLLGVLKLRNEANCLSSVTGARQDHSSGKIFRL